MPVTAQIALKFIRVPGETHSVNRKPGPPLYAMVKANTAQGNLIVGAVSHDPNLYDHHTLPAALEHIEQSRGKAVNQAVCERGYRDKSEVKGTQIILPKKALKKDNRYQRDKKQK